MVISQLFNNALVKVDEKKGEISMRYFDDMDPKYYRPALYTLLLKYRKPIYDFIYKSMRSSIGRQQFDDICLTGILDDLKEDKEYPIKSKLNIYFSLHQYFDKTKNPMIMPSKLEEHKTLMAKVVDDPSVHFTSDDAYAFGAGQLIYYLLSQSEAGERTHAVLEPFLQKTNHSHFNDAIAAILLKYKHAIGFDFKRFNQLAAEVLGYTPEKGLQELRPILLAGYFCPNVLYTKKTDFPS
jgi:CRISPR-associated protein Csh1